VENRDETSYLSLRRGALVCDGGSDGICEPPVRWASIGPAPSADGFYVQSRGWAGVSSQPTAISAEYLIAHSAYTYVIDPVGQLRLLFPFDMSIEEMPDDIFHLMRR
jgi:hypothetical protein